MTKSTLCEDSGRPHLVRRVKAASSSPRSGWPCSQSTCATAMTAELPQQRAHAPCARAAGEVGTERSSHGSAQRDRWTTPHQGRVPQMTEQKPPPPSKNRN
uniref:Uncharacterized protein n=1 Tax=Rousettus aegyptiacus TaxID=9407 RepID=A0A7J8E848_ROUAE|nr:hypothetical protein HJG63_008089 [Rousettus aegyptiacus]